MIINRPLTKEEIVQLLNTAPESEVRNLNKTLNRLKTDAYTFLNKNAVDSYGLIIDGVPVYFAYLVISNGKYALWTVVNSNVKHQFSLFKYSKRELNRVLENYSPIYACMEKCNVNNINWVKRLGFKKIDENDNTVLFQIRRGE